MKQKDAIKRLKNHRRMFIGDPDVDLHAYRESCQTGNQQAMINYSSRKSIWMMAGALAVIVLIATIVPITIVLLQPNLNENVEQQSFYCSSEDVNNEIIDDIESYLAQNNYNIKSINSNVFFAGYVQLLYKEANKPIGIMAEVLVFDEDLEDADVISYIDNYIIDNPKFNDLDNVEIINGIEYKYHVFHESEIVYAIEFKENGILYRIEATASQEMEISKIISKLFN
ncbi:MAG: hypothetical protein E7338_00515 [Clostridiales bacterium]|nr:hypothetical protein [Clostridiales bacterium]